MAKRKNNVLTMIVIVFICTLFIASTCFSLTIEDSIKFHDRGRREYKRGDYNDAIDYFKKAINECPENAMTVVSMYYLGKSYQMAGDTNKAVATFNQLIEKYKSGKWITWAKQALEKLK